MQNSSKYIIALILGGFLVWCLFEPINIVVGKIFSAIIFYAIAYFAVLLLSRFLSRSGRSASSSTCHIIASVVTVFSILN